ncbi:hypothetical protein AcW1_004629 [Taiwanofungus camphoratus]|nr:hypothetical protein AcV5_001014 [Antrodia cinnamomea]KAI0959962.1 hypothetical protein AcW1_004629 [Antrodia cinnamomea]
MAQRSEEFELLNQASLETRKKIVHELRTAPLAARAAYVAAGLDDDEDSQYGVFGSVLAIYDKGVHEVPEDPRLYVHTNAPFSAIVCGVQGSGTLYNPLSGLVLHFGEGGTSSRPCEAAWLGMPEYLGFDAPPIRVYVPNSSLKTMKNTYEPLGSNVQVRPLLFSECELDAEAFLIMMAVGSSDSAPLYIHVILSILRELGENYTFQAFLARLEHRKRSFNPHQLAGLEQRMALLKSFMYKDGEAQHVRFAEGQLTIIDLSDPFIDTAIACGLFEIMIRLFLRTDVNTGKVLVVDEAHKYLSTSKGSSGLTNALTSLTRQQRHLGVRVIISTQEPTTVPPVLLDMCTVAILHRFSSPL